MERPAHTTRRDLNGGRERSYGATENGASPMTSDIGCLARHDQSFAVSLSSWLPRVPLPSSLPHVPSLARLQIPMSQSTNCCTRPTVTRTTAPGSESAKLGNATGTHEALRRERARAHRSPPAVLPPPLGRLSPSSISPLHRPSCPDDAPHTDRSTLNIQERQRDRQTWPRQRWRYARRLTAAPRTPARSEDRRSRESWRRSRRSNSNRDLWRYANV